MFTHTLLLAAALFSTSFHTVPLLIEEASVLAPLGGPPSIRLAGKASGDISKSEWSGLKAIELHGCVPDARIMSLTICIKDCKSKEATATGSDGAVSSGMRTMIANLPAGTAFTVKVIVKDSKGKVWEVPDAKYVWRG